MCHRCSFPYFDQNDIQIACCTLLIRPLKIIVSVVHLRDRGVLSVKWEFTVIVIYFCFFSAIVFLPRELANCSTWSSVILSTKITSFTTGGKVFLLSSLARLPYFRNQGKHLHHFLVLGCWLNRLDTQFFTRIQYRRQRIRIFFLAIKISMILVEKTM